jgi:hypothetical protein
MLKHIKVPFGELNIFPFFMDYDFKLNRPRGFSTKFSFFSYDNLYLTIQKITDLKEIIFIKRDNLYFKNGFFLLDYKEIQEDPEVFCNKFRNMKFNTIYLEKTSIINYEFIFKDTSDINIFMMEII